MAGLAVAALSAAAPVATGASADGKRIAFVRDGEIWTMKADTSDARDTGQAGSQPALGTDGQRIAYTTGGGVSVMFADGTGSSPVAPGYANPAWSPDGTKLVFDDGANVSVGNADGSGSPTTLHSGTQPAWSPDGATIAYVDGVDIYTIPVAGGTPTNLTNSGAADTEPQWSPDSARIVFVSKRDDAVRGELYTMTPAGAAQTRITSDASIETSPSYAPDGATIVFSLDDGSAELYAMGAGGGTMQRLTNNANADTAPDWGSAIANSVKPTVVADSSGLFEDGRTVFANSNAGDWLAASSITSFGYQWQRCNSGTLNCSDISGATGASYQLASADVGATVRAVVFAHSIDGQAGAAADAVGPVTASAPRNNTPPAITGTVSVNQVVAASAGAWLGTTPMTFSYQWRRCDTNGLNCGNIGGATLSTYKLADADAGLRIRVRVIATNGVGSSDPVDSAPSAAVLSDRPTNIVKPTITGLPAAGAKTLGTVAGTWSGNPFPVLTAQWLRCNATGGACVAIAGAISFFYLVTDADAGFTLRVAVTGTNTVGVTTVQSDATNIVPSVPPENVVPPFISGTTTIGQPLTAFLGTWTGSAPITYTFRWRRCDENGGSCADIAGATSTSYQLVQADVGKTLAVVVIATNALGSVSATSNTTAVVTGGGGGGGGTGRAPSNQTPPLVVGRLGKGGKLTATAGVWAGTRPLAYTYLWRRCRGVSLACTTIAGATKKTYAATAADVGKTIRVVVTARNKSGTAVGLSDASLAVAAKKGIVNRLLVGTKKGDRLRGGAGNDMLLGKLGNDNLAGNGGADQIFGNAGRDTISGGAGADRIYGGDGNDTVNVAGGGRDIVDCGAGVDTVRADRNDTLIGCEKIIFPAT